MLKLFSLFFVGLIALCMHVHAYQESGEITKLMFVSDSVFTMRLSEKEKTTIRLIIRSMGEKNIVQLLAKRGTLNRAGDSIHHIPPLTFLAYVFKDKYLKQCMERVRNSVFKWGGFIDGLTPNISRDEKNGVLYSQLKEFADFLNANHEILYKKAKEKNWSGFVEALL